MLLNNGTFFGRIKPVAGSLRANGLLGNSAKAMLRDNTMRFGSFTSVPQGYQSAYRAVVPTIKESSLISARITGTGSLVNLQVRNAVSMSAIIAGEGFLDGASEVGKTMSATVVGLGSLAGDARVLVSMTARLDAGVRPSAFDIAQEVWQSQKTSYNAAGTMGNALNNASSGGIDYAALAAAVNSHIIEGGITLEQALRILLAPLAGKATGIGTGTEVYMKQDGVTPRLTATFDSSGNRTEMEIDPT